MDSLISGFSGFDSSFITSTILRMGFTVFCAKLDEVTDQAPLVALVMEVVRLGDLLFVMLPFDFLPLAALPETEALFSAFPG